MSTKIYKAHNNLSVPNLVNGKISGYINFTEENHTFRTSDEILQRSLESLPCFQSLFFLYREEEAKPEIPNPNIVVKDYREVIEWQEAKDLLRNNYSVAHQSLNTPANILKKAKEVGVSFSNLKLPEE